MNEFLSYIVQASIILALFYMIYFLFLQNEKFYVEIRAYLVVSVMLTVILPFVKIPYQIIEESIDQEGGGLFAEAIPTNLIVAQDEGGVPFYQILLGIYLIVVFVLLIRSVIHVLRIRGVLKNQEIIKEDDAKIILLDQETPAFTFFEYVIISRSEFNNESLQNILIHEKVHASQKHWIDLLLIEALCILLWFNPFVWLFQLAIKQTHELLADDGVLARGFSVGQYQAQLINQLMGDEVIGLTNNFNFSINKKRMIMMTKEESNGKQRYKLLLILPVIVATILFNLQITTEALAQNEEVVAISKKGKVEIFGQVMAKDGKPIPGAAIVIKDSKVGTVSDLKGKFKIDADKNETISIAFIGMKTKEISVKDFMKKQRKAKNGNVIVVLENGSGSMSSFRQESSKSIADDAVFVIVEKMPKFPGGHGKLDETKNYATARIAQRYMDAADCYVTFIVSKDGSVQRVKIVRSSGNKDADQEAMNFVKKLPTWEAGMQRGQNVNVSYTLPFYFSKAR